jgi:serine/threonine protein phosphatase PrpC
MKGALDTEGALRFRKGIDFADGDILGAREIQEDYSLFRAGPSGAELLAVLADGMGGHTGGEVASKLAVDAFVATFNAYPAGSVPVKLGAALNEANNHLASGIKNAPALEGMGCTLVGMYIDAQGLQWISVGDSPLFLYRNGLVTRLNADHSMAPVIEESLRQGRITKEEASSHPSRNVLRSALTGESLAMIDTPNAPRPLCKGDVVILASDGLLSLSQSEIAAVVTSNPGATAERLAQMLVLAVETKKKLRQDNTTVQVIIVPTSLGVTRSLTWIFGLLAVLLGIAMGGYGYLNHQRIVDLWTSLQWPSLKTHPPEPVIPKAVPIPTDVPVSPAATESKVPEPEKEASPPNKSNDALPAEKSAKKGKKDPQRDTPKDEITNIPKAAEQAPAAKPPSTQDESSSKPSENTKAPDALKPESGKGSAAKADSSGVSVQSIPSVQPLAPAQPLPPVQPDKPKSDQPTSKPEAAKPPAQPDKGSIEKPQTDKKT